MARSVSWSVNSYFNLRGRGSSVGRELRGAVATFLTMAYILFANPDILAAAGVPRDSARACTALAAGICCILMGLVANFPLALASGMGLNAVVAFTVTKAAGSWQAAMGVIVLDGLITLLLVLGGLREAILRAIPRDLRLAIGAGIGLFIALLGLVSARLIVIPAGTLAVLTRDPTAAMPVLGPGSLHDRTTLVALAGLLITAALMARRITGALLIGIVATTIIALLCGAAHVPHGWSRPDFSAAFHADLRGALRWELLPILFSVIMVDFFDTLGTATAIAEEAKLIDDRGNIPKIRRILMVDSISAAIGGMLGASSVTSYIESAAGVADGARTGLHSVFVGIFFLLSIIIAPLVGSSRVDLQACKLEYSIVSPK